MGSEARARLGLAAMLAVTLFSFMDLFAEGDYPGPSMLGMLLAAGITILARRIGLGVFGTFAMSIAGLGWYLVLVFQFGNTLFGLPTPSAISGVIRAVDAAYGHSSVDFAPIPVRPGYVIMVIVAMWLLTSLGEVSTFRLRKPLLAAIPTIALFAFILVVGTGKAAPLLVPLFLAALFTYWGLEAAHRLRSWGRWIPTWKEHESEPEPETVTGPLARRMAASCVAVALVVPMFLPALEQGLLAWRNGTGPGQGEGEGVGGEINPLVSLVPKLINQTDRVLFTVEADRNDYWRLITLTEFDGTDWTPGNNGRSPISADGSTVVNAAVQPRPGIPLDHTITVDGLKGEFLPAANLPVSVLAQGTNAEARQTELNYDQITGDLGYGSPLGPGLEYDVRSITPDAGFRSLAGAEPTAVEPLAQEAVVVSDEVRALARRWTRGIEDPLAQLLALQRNLRGSAYEYADDVQDQSTTSDALTRFLLESRRGACQQFAASFAVLARVLDFRSRVVVGFLPGSADPADPDLYTVRGTDAHAWPEIRFDGLGWVRFEPTPRAGAEEPRWTVPPVNLGGLEDLQDFGSLTGGQNGGRLNAPDARREPPLRTGQQPGAPAGPQGDAAWERTFARILTGSIVLLILFFISVPALKQARIRRRYARASGARSFATAAFAEFQDEASELAVPRGRAESASAYAARLVRLRKVPARPAQRLAALYEAAQYAPDDLAGEHGTEARRLATQLRAKLWSGATWWSRLNRLFAPGTIAPRRR